jgi:hypothetical protein
MTVSHQLRARPQRHNPQPEELATWTTMPPRVPIQISKISSATQPEPPRSSFSAW